QKPLEQSHAAGRLVVEGCRFWSPEDPYLYTLRFSLSEGDTVVDQYELEVGVREIKVDGAKLLLNGRPVFLKGFGKHEDFAVLGKGLSHPLIVKDFQLMKWLGANSFRTSHYPYAEETLQMADRLGFLVIDECPAVSLNFKHVNDQTLHNHKTSLTELIARDRNHACVIAWSLGNEPGIWLEEEATLQKAEDYWSTICDHVRSLEPSRPITLPTCANLRDREITHKFVDFISINRYWGWYETPTDIEKAGEQLETELQTLFKEHQKPILVAEFGADTVEGLHATYPQLYTEEYQVMLIEKYFEVIESLPFVVGEHIWNFADFRTAQHHRRVVLNKKGVFNRQREPKAAAFAVRKHWLARPDRTEDNQVNHKRSPKKR
ncbi:MAG: glycoside hydrolase family 2 TIM barrel-domain containing protein, partial [Candidatus Zixiibacteriota bacterium]